MHSFFSNFEIFKLLHEKLVFSMRLRDAKEKNRNIF